MLSKRANWPRNYSWSLTAHCKSWRCVKRVIVCAENCFASLRTTTLSAKAGRFRDILETVGLTAPTTSSVLITGERGTGKGLVARAIHEASLRRERHFVSINCGAFPEALLESELFGYLKGAFTGAETNRKGIIESADGGTLFRDEIGETSPTMQVKLLRVLQERRVRPLGGSSDVSVDVRLIASTNRDLKRMVAAGQFREDFYYRISVIPIHVPPLRERPDDIASLARHFLHKFGLQMGKGELEFKRDVLELLTRYSWPGMSANSRMQSNMRSRCAGSAMAESAWNTCPNP